MVSSTITSSSFSRFAEGFTRICLYVTAGFYLRDDADRQILGEDAVHAAGDDALPYGDLVVVADILHVE